jgi:hypothetical protein
MAWKVYWDNGRNACGTFPDEFETEEDAQAYADPWMAERNAEEGLDPDDEESYFAEVVPSKNEAGSGT